MKQYYLFLICICLYSLSSCEDKRDAAFRSVSTDVSYSTNNKVAALRLHSITYNEDAGLEPVERFKMVHISDAHLSSYSSSNKPSSPKNLIEAIKFSNQQDLSVDAIVATGDHISYAKKSDAQLALNSFYHYLYENNSIPTFPCNGNHDSNTTESITEEAIIKQEHYTAFSNKGNYPLHRESGENYYYADVKNPMGGMIRIIALDMLDQPAIEYNTLQLAIYSQKQIDWFCNKALKENMTDQHSVIIITHFPFESYSSATKMASFLIDAKYLYSTHLIPEIVEAFREKKTLNQTYPNLINKKDSIFVNTDFSSYRGDFICYMGGHSHITTQFDVTSIRNRSTALQPQRMLLCTNMSPSEIGKVFNRVNREPNTVTDNSFCIYAIDTIERNIYITFFGAYLPSDKSAEQYPEIQVLSY